MPNRICCICKTKFFTSHSRQKCCSIKCSKRLKSNYKRVYERIHKEKIRIQKKEWDKTYYLKHKKEHNKKSKEYREKHREEMLFYLRDYSKTHRKEAREYYQKNKDRINRNRRKYLKRKKSENPSLKILLALRNRIRAALRYNVKSESTKELLGCSLEFLKLWLELQFEDGMTWKNYGKRGWVIDHIKPCVSFDLRQASEQRKCFHYTNLQPLWELANLQKATKQC